jgi:hypothetical protein
MVEVESVADRAMRRPVHQRPILYMGVFAVGLYFLTRGDMQMFFSILALHFILFHLL